MSAGHTAFFGQRSAVLIGVDAGPEMLSAVGAAVAAARPLSELLAALTARGLEQAPDFACVVHTAAASRLLVRGHFTATSRDAAGEVVTTTGQDVSTWVELLLPALPPTAPA